MILNRHQRFGFSLLSLGLGLFVFPFGSDLASGQDGWICYKTDLDSDCSEYEYEYPDPCTWTCLSSGMCENAENVGFELSNAWPIWTTSVSVYSPGDTPGEGEYDSSVDSLVDCGTVYMCKHVCEIVGGVETCVEEGDFQVNAFSQKATGDDCPVVEVSEEDQGF